MATDAAFTALLRHEPLSSAVAGETCAMHLEHSPRLLAVHNVLLFPADLQRAVWGEVRDERTTTVCPTGRLHVLMALSDLLSGNPWQHHYSQSERRLALTAFDSYMTAKEERR